MTKLLEVKTGRLKLEITMPSEEKINIYVYPDGNRMEPMVPIDYSYADYEADVDIDELILQFAPKSAFDTLPEGIYIENAISPFTIQPQGTKFHFNEMITSIKCSKDKLFDIGALEAEEVKADMLLNGAITLSTLIVCEALKNARRAIIAAEVIA